jgi:hypothetical protein
MKDLYQFYLQEWQRMQMRNNGCMPTMMYGFIIASLVICTLCGCKTTTSSEQTIDYRHMSRLTERMDSLIHSTSTWQQSIYEKQTSLVDSFKHSDVRDTSHTIFLGAKGDTVKETIVIKEYIEREHTSSESTREHWEERFRQTDSLLQVAIEKQAETDSILQSHNKETVVEKQPSLGDKLKWFAGGMILTIIGGISCATAFIKKSS